MFSESFKDALTEDVVGQPRAVNAVVRGVTRLMSGLTPWERSWCVYLLIGPPGTGRTHLVRTLARLIHGGEAFTVSCNMSGRADPWTWFAQQMTPLFGEDPTRPAAEKRPGLSAVLVQDLECAPKEFFPILARALETGQLTLPGGRRGKLNNCVVFLTSGLCSSEILDTSLGFSGAATSEGDREEMDTLVKICTEGAEKAFGLNLLAQLDDLIVFRKLEDEHLAGVLQRHFARMSRWLGRDGVQCEMLPAAEAFLLERSARQAALGARNLILAHRQEVEFPLADLLMSRQLDAGRRVVVDHRPGEQHLHFTVETSEEALAVATQPVGAFEVPVG